MYGKFKIKYFWARNMFSRSNICLAKITSSNNNNKKDQLNTHRLEICSVGQKGTYKYNIRLSLSVDII